mgnify:CR=1 FL=1
MNFKMAMSNWINFFRMAVGLPKTYPVKVHRSDEAKKFPLIRISKDGDVGYDLISIKDVVVPAMSEEQKKQFIRASSLPEDAREKALKHLPKAVIPTGISLEMNNNCWCSIEARSSASNKMLITPDAIIDSGYRGELFAVVYNFGYQDYTVKKGERVAQVIFHERVIAKIKEVDKLSDSERGTTGFGSTGD